MGLNGTDFIHLWVLFWLQVSVSNQWLAFIEVCSRGRGHSRCWIVYCITSLTFLFRLPRWPHTQSDSRRRQTRPFCQNEPPPLQADALLVWGLLQDVHLARSFQISPQNTQVTHRTDSTGGLCLVQQWFKHRGCCSSVQILIMWTHFSN